MKVKYLFFILFLAFLACEGEIVDPELRARSVELFAEIEGVKTWVAGSSWEKDDAIGVYMMKSGEPLNSSVIRENVKYVTEGTSAFQPAHEMEAIVFPFNGSDVDFISYYPYQENISDNIYPIDLRNQSSQSRIDLLYSDNARKKNEKNPNVGMLFSHQLSKIVLNIEHYKSMDLSTLNVIITNAGTEASFDLATGTLLPTTEYGDIIFHVDAKASAGEAILLPETDLSGMELWFVIGDEVEVYQFSLEEVFEINAFAPSTMYTYNVTLFTNETAIISDGTISAWIDGPSVEVTAQRTEATPPIIKGSKKTPFTVAETQVSTGRDQVWVEGYIVGSFTSSTMNSFLPGATQESNPANIALADTPDETDREKVIPVQLSSGTSVREDLNLVDNPDKLNRKVKIKGNIASYYSVMGLRDNKEYEYAD